MYQINSKKLSFHYIILNSILLSIILSVFQRQGISNSYNIIWIQPLIYLLIYIFILIPLIETKEYKVTVYSFVFLSWIRCVIIPLGISLTGSYGSSRLINTNYESIRHAIILVTYELIITSIYLFFIIKVKKRRNDKVIRKINSEDISLVGNKKIYFIFIAFAAGLYLFYGKNLIMYDFFMVSADTGMRQGDIESTSLSLLITIFSSAILFFFLWSVDYSKRKFDDTGKNKYINWAMLVGVFYIGLITGERRTSILYKTFTVLVILLNTFNSNKKKISTTIISFSISMLMIMSIYKHFYVFAYDSYATALKQSTMSISSVSDTLQSYFFGPKNVAMSIDFSLVKDISIVNLIYDFGRSIFGIKFLIKGKMVMTSELFNTFIYGTPTKTGHVLSGVGYGYLYLGSLLSPTIVCLNIYITTKLEKTFNKVNSSEMKYISGYMLLRFSTNLFATTPPLINLTTTLLFTSGLVYYVAYIFRGKKNRNEI